jgi:hypothetical protein
MSKQKAYRIKMLRNFSRKNRISISLKSKASYRKSIIYRIKKKSNMNVKLSFTQYI